VWLCGSIGSFVLHVVLCGEACRHVHVLLPREFKIALKSMVAFLNTYFELLQFIDIIYITNKCNQ
jgi:hypothetical protein